MAHIALAIGVFERAKDPLPASLLIPFPLFVNDGQEWYSLVKPDLSAGMRGEEAAENAAIFCNACRRRLFEGLIKSVL